MSCTAMLTVGPAPVCSDDEPRRVEVGDDDLVGAAEDDGVVDAGKGLRAAVERGEEVRVGGLLPVRRRALHVARDLRVERAVVGRVEADDVVDERRVSGQKRSAQRGTIPPWL